MMICIQSIQFLSPNEAVHKSLCIPKKTCFPQMFLYTPSFAEMLVDRDIF